MKCQYKIFGISFILIGLIVFLISTYKEYNLNNKESKSVDAYFEKIKTIYNSPEEIEDNLIVKNNDPIYDYVGILEIPKINFKRGFTNIEDPNNNVNKNIQLLKNSDMPDVKGGTLIIAGHSGSGHIAFFKNLYKLYINDDIYVYYNNKKYSYTVINKYEVEKTGKLSINSNEGTTTLILITCSYENKTKQIIFICELKNIDLYN